MGNNRYKSDDDDRLFFLPTGQQYYTEVHKKTGEITLFHIGGKGEDTSNNTPRKVGTLKDNEWTTEEGHANEEDNATTDEILMFRETRYRNLIKTSARNVVKHAYAAEDPDAGEITITQVINLLSRGIPLGSESTDYRSLETIAGSMLTGYSKKLIYPLDLSATEQDRIVFSMIPYIPSGIEGAGGEAVAGKRTSSVEKKNVKARIFLPIPAGINDSNSVQWRKDDMNSYQMALAAVAVAGIEGGMGEMIGKFKEKAAKISKGVGSEEAVKNLFAAKAVGSNMKSLLVRTEGAVMNPNMELLFDAPTLREFTFKFLMSPRSEDEGKAIIQIIRTFKQGMSAQRTNGRLFLKTPFVWLLEYKRGVGGSQWHEQWHKNLESTNYLNKFKECALTNCAVNYTPNGSYSTYQNGVMVAYELTLSFQELTPIYLDDYGDSEEDYKTSIGY